MNYQQQIKNLLAEARSGIRYKNMSTGVKVLTIIAMLPVYAVACALVGSYYVLLFFYNALLSPTSYLEEWLDEKKSGVKHATEAVLYAICIPVIFLNRVLMSIMGYGFYFVWSLLQISVYLSTLGGIKWQPSINIASFDKNRKYNLRPGETGTLIFTILAFGFFALYILLFIIYSSERSWELYRSTNTVGIIYALIITILNPILFAKREISDADAERINVDTDDSAEEEIEETTV